MLQEIRTYTLVPGGAREYLRIYNECGRETQTRTLGTLTALLVPETGDLNQLVYCWAYDDFEQRTRRRSELLADPVFTEFRKKVRHLLVRQESRLFHPA